MAGLLFLPKLAQSGEVGFRLHTIDATSTYSAAAAIDVNRDGELDVVCGGWWYEAPTWKRHFLRDVRVIRGRYDDYAHLPMDVNGDGWTDYVSANWRSQSLYWVQHPGPSLGPWTKHLIARPGGMETARLVDVDGDGRLDVLPNCVRTPTGQPFAAWWELQQPSPNQPARWLRHELPADIAGHGIGFGDLNNDGRKDIVGTQGWLEAPLDRRRDRWQWPPDFELDRDCSIPILVHDVDGDGDTDLIWGRAHNIGLYWLEQRTNERATRWVRHAIDTSWAQAHSLLLADLDNDGSLELVAGKRYLGHEGNDPGEYDPLVAYWYQFDAQRRTWQRGVISAGGPAGFGLDPKAIDLDGDGIADKPGDVMTDDQLTQLLGVLAMFDARNTAAHSNIKSGHEDEAHHHAARVNIAELPAILWCMGAARAPPTPPDEMADIFHVTARFPKLKELDRQSATEQAIRTGLYVEFIKHVGWIFHAHLEPKYPDKYKPELDRDNPNLEL